MSNRTLEMTDAVYEYLLSVSLREDALLARLREETGNHPMAVMQISPEQGQFMALLTRLLGAVRCVEVGVFTGYSSLCVARALPANGTIVACDVSEEYTNIARRYWAEAGLEHRIDLRLAPAVGTLDALLDSGETGRFDFGFIDADKENYPAYYERLLRLVRPGGLIAVDNTLWSGRLADEAREDDDADTRALRAFNKALHGDERVDLSLVPIGDGLTLARVR